MATRKYEQRVRAEAAEETRRRIIDALYERLRAAPTRPASVDEVAKAAGVARSTVYLVFGSRAGLFDALNERLLEGEEFAQLQAALDLPDARDSLRGALAAGAKHFAAHREVFRILNSSIQLDPEATSGAVERGEERRARGIARLVRRLADQGHLRDDVTPKQATDVVWLLAGFDAFDQLYSVRGLSARAAGRTLVDTAERALLNTVA